LLCRTSVENSPRRGELIIGARVCSGGARPGFLWADSRWQGDQNLPHVVQAEPGAGQRRRGRPARARPLLPAIMVTSPRRTARYFSAPGWNSHIVDLIERQGIRADVKVRWASQPGCSCCRVAGAGSDVGSVRGRVDGRPAHPARPRRCHAPDRTATDLELRSWIPMVILAERRASGQLPFERVVTAEAIVSALAPGKAVATTRWDSPPGATRTTGDGVAKQTDKNRPDAQRCCHRTPDERLGHAHCCCRRPLLPAPGLSEPPLDRHPTSPTRAKTPCCPAKAILSVPTTISPSSRPCR